MIKSSVFADVPLCERMSMPQSLQGSWKSKAMSKSSGSLDERTWESTDGRRPQLGSKEKDNPNGPVTRWGWKFGSKDLRRSTNFRAAVGAAGIRPSLHTHEMKLKCTLGKVTLAGAVTDESITYKH